MTDIIDEVVEEVELAEEASAPVEVTKEPKVAAPLKIQRGRMPLPLVWWIRFVECAVTKDENGDDVMQTDSAIAHKYFTTPGKINDIRKNANFKYINDKTVFNENELDKAIADIKHNFTNGKRRGQPDAKPDTTLEDAAYAIGVLEGMEAGESTTAADKAAYNEANPKAKKAEKPAAEAVEEMIEEAPAQGAISDEDLEGLLE